MENDVVRTTRELQSTIRQRKDLADIPFDNKYCLGPRVLFLQKLHRRENLLTKQPLPYILPRQPVPRNGLVAPPPLITGPPYDLWGALGAI